MEEEKTIIEHLENAKKPPYESVAAAFEEWWGNSTAKRGQGELTRRQVAEAAYGAGSVLGARYPELVRFDEIGSLAELLTELQAKA